MKKLALLVFLLGIVLAIGSVSAESCNGQCPPEYKRPCADVDICTWTTSGDPNCGLPLGSEDTANCGLSWNTYWSVGTTATATCIFDGDDLEDAMLYISINNDVIQCTLNGDLVFENYIHENCAPEDPRDGFSQDIYDDVSTGTNTLICEVEDRGVMTHFDACVIGEYAEPTCELIIDEPVDGEWYDPVTISWDYEGDCDIINQKLYYYERNCEADSNYITSLSSGPRTYPWDVSGLEDGPYCVSVYSEQHGELDEVEGFSGIFYLDLTPPEVLKRVGPENVPCEEGGDCDYYVNTKTPIYFSCYDETLDEYQEEMEAEIEVRYSLNGGEFTEWEEYDEPFYFNEDSEHILEARCRFVKEYDARDYIGKWSEIDRETFIVDSQAPVIEKEVQGPQVGNCPPGEGENCWITQNTHIIATATDPTPHPVEGVECEYHYELDGGVYVSAEVDCEGDVCDITFPENTEHELSITCWDALGNEYTDVETFYVDSDAPTTRKWYDGPQYYSQGYAHWINGVTTVNLEAVDNPKEPCAVGVDKIFVRNTLVDNRYCESEASGCSAAEGEGDFVEYVDPFTMEESCHLIEFYSVDELGNEETINKECVYVDKTAPETHKDVGKPSHDCHGLWEQIAGKCQENWDWIITMDTKIELSCEDQDPHPSEVQELCWRIELDGEYAMEEYTCEGSLEEYSDETWCCVPSDEVTVEFTEESEHLLEFYCVDNVEKTSEIDSEMFKVEGEEFTIDLYKKWNLISIPFNLISNNIEEVFEQVSEKVEAVWAYKDGEWYVYSPEGPSTLETIDPGYGYWVKTNAAAELTVGGSLLSSGPGVPPSVDLQEGWNLIGRYGLAEDQSAYCALFSLVDTSVGFPRWSALYGYDNENKEFKNLGVNDPTNPGEGYWIEMDVKDTYSPSTICWYP